LMRAEASPAEAKSPAVMANVSLNPSVMALISRRAEGRADTAARRPHRELSHR